jgi:dolichol kinase
MSISKLKKLQKLRKEFLRKSIHLTGVFLILAHALLRFYWTDRAALLFLAAVLLILLKIEYLRLEYKFDLPEALKLFRHKEKNHAAGWIFFVSAMIIVFAAFDYEIALTALLMTMFGDMFSALVGMKFGKKKLFRKKTLVGFVAGLISNILTGVVILGNFPALILTMALMASLIELITNKMDDNLTVPLFAAYSGHLILLASGETARFSELVWWFLGFFI